MLSRLFLRYLGIDYSGAATARTGLTGIRVYQTTPGHSPIEIRPPSGHWSRDALAAWLAYTLADGSPTLVGIDHGLSFPSNYFQHHGLEKNWRSFLADFHTHWPTDQANTTVRELRPNNLRTGEPRWRRQPEKRCAAKSVFHFDVPGSVATSTHAGLPWIHQLTRQLPAVHYWPFDGWAPTKGKSVLTEAYPALCSKLYPQECRTPDQHDAYSLARWFEELDQKCQLANLFQPALAPEEREIANHEGWILGVE